jgi:hypothetical protein
VSDDHLRGAWQTLRRYGFLTALACLAQETRAELREELLKQFPVSSAEALSRILSDLGGDQRSPPFTHRELARLATRAQACLNYSYQASHQVLVRHTLVAVTECAEPVLRDVLRRYREGVALPRSVQVPFLEALGAWEELRRRELEADRPVWRATAPMRRNLR